VSASVGSQAKHVAPPAPHVERLFSLQVVPSQQPVHDVASQTQRLPTHRCPPEHALCPPHVQSPAAEQPSAAIAPHAMHAPPPAPHVDADGTLQVVPVQHPLGHMQLLHAPAAQVSPAGQEEQVRPALPHVLATLPGSHVPPLQHPVGHDVASHVHCPATQCWPAPHAALAPQRQPLLSQHAPPVHWRPGGHGAPPAHAAPS